MSIINKLFKWDLTKFLNATLGTIIFAFGLNVFIVPMGLYTGGILGISQLIRTLLINTFNIHLSFDISGIINFLINIPLFILAYKEVSKTFFTRTLFCVAIQTIALSLIPIPKDPIITDLLTATLVGGIIVGFGSGLVLKGSSSGGGTDIIGVALTKRNKNISVGKIGLTINIVIYIICGILFGLETMIYSIIYSVFSTLIVDKTHEQNICSSAMIFTKKEPTKLVEYIEKELKRGSTFWEGNGGYDKTKTYITYASLSKYELQRLERHLKELDKDAFMVKTNELGIVGNFEKYL